LLVVIALVALGLWAWPAWVRYRTERTLRSVGLLWDKDTATRQRAGTAILANGGGWPSVPPLVEALRSDDSGLRFTAAWALCGVGPDAGGAVPALITLLDDPSLYVRQMAPQTLGAIGAAARPALPALTRAVHDQEWIIRTKAAEALFEIDPSVVSDDAVAALEELLEHPDPIARSEARRILGRLMPPR
jgi:HEAT repeat protein